MKSTGSFLFYQTEDGKSRIQVVIDGQTVWLSEKVMADLYQTTVANINIHIKGIYEDRELDPSATIKKYLIVQTEGSREVERLVEHYNLEVILAVGYRVRSARGTQFRRWATQTLREFLTKGFVLDDERLKSCEKIFGQDYFDELLERIRDIRASERRFYQKITDIYATSCDYDPNAAITHTFYATVQNKLHWAITGHTAAEIISLCADADKLNMGLTTWKNAPKGKIRKTDVTIAKNYLLLKEITALNRIVNMYLDYAEDQAEQHHLMTMQQWADRLDAFLQFNNRAVLKDAGRISADVAEKLAITEFEKYHAGQLRIEAQQPTSDFDKLIKNTKKETVA
jgi:hypothetical protein